MLDFFYIDVPDIIEGCQIARFSVSTPKCVRGVTALHTSLEEQGVPKTNPPKIRVEKSNSQPIPSTNLFVCLIGSEGYLGNVTLDTGKNGCLFEEATPLDLRFFLHVFICFQFFDLHPKSISPKKNSS